ncbi:hypothetical protein [Pseudomonas indica]|uniref:hypothetical protein n=1 Tax=Pseudomonas indica TaxID=137658 RepID=UPI001140E6DA|nr:hypothetical protein [Pseudomonas indica]
MFRKYSYAWVSGLLTIMTISACDGKKEPRQSPEQIAYQKQLERCRVELNKSELVPIIGGGHVDMSRFGFMHSNIRYEDGQCGTSSFETSFWWTGKEVLPDNEKFFKIKRTEIPESWKYFNVAGGFSNQRKARKCKANPELSECKVAAAGYQKVEWPAELTVKLKNYPGLEVWLEVPPPHIKNQYAVDEFVMIEWRRKDGTPRGINCWGLSPNDEQAKSQRLDPISLALMSRAELENIDFRGKLNHGVACQVEFWNFDFEGGAARVSMSTETLSVASKALPAISEYISKSIIRDDENEL